MDSTAEALTGVGAYKALVAPSALYAYSPFYNNNIIHVWQGAASGWSKIGDQCRSYVTVGDGLYGLSLSGAVVQYASPMVWDTIGGPFDGLYGAGYGLFGRSYDGYLSRWDGALSTWAVVSGPARAFVVNDVGLYRLALDGSGIWIYQGEGMSWAKIGGAATSLYAVGDGLYAVQPDGLLYRWDNAPFSWTAVGTPWQNLAFTGTGLFGLGLHGGNVYKFNGTPMKWSKVGGQYTDIFGGPFGLYATSLWGDEFFSYDGIANTWTSIGTPCY